MVAGQCFEADVVLSVLDSQVMCLAGNALIQSGQSE
jgi:hypothetical protein